jgi:flagellar biosynthesis protein FlhA
VFGVLLIVNFMVITKGATRMAEVGARFALDGMPGKQMAIDADMSAGAIDHNEARARRELEQMETTFFGSLDGASKFVKGDAVAGLLITLLNLIMGLIMGVIVHKMPVGAAFETYAILTVGDGLVTQIPAVIISIASALLLARGGATGATELTLLRQLGGLPYALSTVAVLMALFALVPGLPFIPFIIGATLLAFAAYRRYRAQLAERSQSHPDNELEPIPREKPIADVLALDDIHLEFAPDLVNMVLDPGTGLDVRISNMRQHVASSYGMILPEIRLTDEAILPRGTYVIRIHGVEVARAALHAEKVLALIPDQGPDLPAGEDVLEPVYHAPARWLEAGDQETAAMSGATIVSPTEVLATHLLEEIKKNFGKLLTFKATRRLLDEMVSLSDPVRADANRKLLDELIPERVPLETLHQVLKALLEEQVSIRNLPLILEAIAEGRAFSPNPEIICEHVRQRLGFQLVSGLKREDGTIPLLQLAPEWEETFGAYQLEGDFGANNIALPPDLFNKLASGLSAKVAEAAERGVIPALVTSTKRRRYLKTLVQAKGISTPVLSFEEIGLEARPSLVGMVQA